MPDATQNIAALIARLANSDARAREQAAREIFRQGCAAAEPVLAKWFSDQDFRALARSGNTLLTVGIAVEPSRFQAIHAASGKPRLADVPPDQDAQGIHAGIRPRRAPRCPDAAGRRRPGRPREISRALRRRHSAGRVRRARHIPSHANPAGAFRACADLSRNARWRRRHPRKFLPHTTQ